MYIYSCSHVVVLFIYLYIPVSMSTVCPVTLPFYTFIWSLSLNYHIKKILLAEKCLEGCEHCELNGY